MIPIRELLSRIHRDKDFGQGKCINGYYDRVEDAIIRLPLREMLVRPDDHFAFDIIDQESVLQNIPLHRIREVYKDGELIWHRERGK
jgi:uncharacterized protein (UPF0248 family)